MSEQSKRREAVRVVLSEHATAEYTDDEANQVECVCGWQSHVFLPGGLVNVYDVISTHQVNMLVEAGLV